jgi:molybdate transport system substrate-binding protein
MRINLAIALSLFAAAFTSMPTSAPAAELKVLSGNGARAAVRELCEQFERASGHKVTVHFEVNAALEKKIAAGESFDVAVLNPQPLDASIRNGRIVAASRAVLGRIGLGAAVKAGAPKPDISTVERFKTALLATRGVAYPGEGASGRYFAALVERMGIGEQMKPKMRPMAAEDTVEVVARGEADMVVVVASRIVGVPGVEFIGLIPTEVQAKIGFATGISSATREPDAARALVRHLTAPEAAAVLRKAGIEPFVE